MNDNFTDRLLDASLREYSQVTPPEGFAVLPVPRRRPSFWWLSLPAMAAAAAVVVWMPRPIVVLPPPRLAAVPESAPVVTHTVRPRHVRPIPQYRVLTAVEIARLGALPEVFVPREEKQIADLDFPDLEVKALESANPNPKE